MLTTNEYQTLTELGDYLNRCTPVHLLPADHKPHRIGATGSSIPEYAYTVSVGTAIYHITQQLVEMVCGSAPTTNYRYDTTTLLALVERAIRKANIDKILTDLV